eukprot:m51a1_g4732 putative dual specificity protein phosphatase 1-like (413) ;mRNA; r:354559-356276
MTTPAPSPPPAVSALELYNAFAANRAVALDLRAGGDYRGGHVHLSAHVAPALAPDAPAVLRRVAEAVSPFPIGARRLVVCAADPSVDVALLCASLDAARNYTTAGDAERTACVLGCTLEEWRARYPALWEAPGSPAAVPLPAYVTLPSEVLEGFLLLGAYGAREWALALGVTHIVNACGEFADPRDAAAARCRTLYVPVSDVATCDIARHFDEVIAFVEEARSEGGRVLVHCLAGASRSPALVMAYLMARHAMTLEQAAKFVEARRPVYPNKGFKNALARFEATLAQRASRQTQDPAEDLRRARRLATLLDSQWSVAGVAVGLDALVGLVPGVGDALGAVAGVYPLLLAQHHGLGRRAQAAMAANIAIDAAVGSVPVVGDLFDVAFRANLRNVAVLERCMRERGLVPREKQC